MKTKHLICLWSLVLWGLSVYAQAEISITHGPYLQAVGQTGLNIVWTSNRDAIGWVELAPDDSSHFYATERPKYFDARAGLKQVSAFHNVRIEGLKPGVTYRYRVVCQEVLHHEGFQVLYGEVASTNVYRKKPLKFRTAPADQESVAFAIINDIHGNNGRMDSLLRQNDLAKTDLVFFNGDMANDLRSEEQLFDDYMDTGVKCFASEVPMYYARGNHETRGQFAAQFVDYFPAPTGELYYMFQRGPVCFIVLDSGEDKPDSDIEYNGITDFDVYRDKQAAWLKTALQQPMYQQATYKVVVCHIPPFGGWHGEQEVADKFVPLLNEAGAQVMLSGHLHRHVKQGPTPGKHQFPVLVNSNMNMIKATADSKQLTIEVLNTKGQVIDSMALHPSR